MSLMRNSLSVSLMAGLFVACGPGNGLSPAASVSNSFGAKARQASGTSPTGSRRLYVANDITYSGSVSAYSGGRKKLTLAISKDVNEPSSLALDGSGNLYVANVGCPYGGCPPKMPSTVTVYAAESGNLLRRITQGVRVPAALAFDASGNLYVMNTFGNHSQGSISVYAPGSKTVTRTISQGIDGPNGLAFDGSGDLYVANESSPYYLHGNVAVYSPGSGSVLRTISQGIKVPGPIAVDGAGTLYVANSGGVTVYAPGSESPLRTITTPGVPWALALDASGNLYVANCCIIREPGSVTVYGVGTGSLLRTISQGIGDPGALAFDESGNLYVANGGRRRFVYGHVSVYAPGSTSVLRWISQGVENPRALVFGQ